MIKDVQRSTERPDRGSRVIRETGAHEKPGPQVTFSVNVVSPLW